MTAQSAVEFAYEWFGIWAGLVLPKSLAKESFWRRKCKAELRLYLCMKLLVLVFRPFFRSAVVYRTNIWDLSYVEDSDLSIRCVFGEAYQHACGGRAAPNNRNFHQ